MKEFLKQIVFTSFFLFFSITVFAQATLDIDEVSGVAGSSVTVPINAQNLTNLAGYQWTIEFDASKLQFVSFSNWAAGIDLAELVVVHDAGLGKLMFVYNDYPTAMALANGVFFNLNFTVNVGATGVAPVTWSDDPTLRELSNSIPVEMPATWEVGQVIIDLYWDGSTSTDWQDITNWTPEIIPTALLSQGFFIKTDNSAGGTFTIPTIARTHDDQPFWKTPKNLPDVMRLKIESGGYSDETVIRFMDEASAGFDGDFDAYKRYSWGENVPQISTVDLNSNIEFAINSLNFSTDLYTIPMSYKVPSAGTYGIQVSELNLNNIFVAFLDNILGTEVEMQPASVHNFTATAAGVNSSQLELIFERNVAPTRQTDIADQVTFTDSPYQFAISSDNFADANRFDKITLSATLDDGSPLPTWLSYDAQTQTLSGITSSEQILYIRITATDRFGLTATSTYKLQVKSPVSVEDVENSEMSVYPNPATNVLSINLKTARNYTLDMRTVLGQEIYRNAFENSKSNVIDLHGIAAGVYFLTLTFDDNSTPVRKIVVEK